MPAAGAEALFASDPEATRDYHRLRTRARRIGHDAARRVDPDQARHIAWHACRIGRKDATLIDHPGGTGIRLAEFLDHLNIGGQVNFGTAQGAWQCQMEQPGVRQRLEERTREFPRGLDLIGAGTDLGHELLYNVERRSDLGFGHRSRPSGSIGAKRYVGASRVLNV